MGKVGTSGTVSHCLTLVSCPFFDALNDQRKRDKERKRGVSNASDQGTPQRKHNCLLHCQPMAIPASSPLNIKHKHNVHTICHFSVRPHCPIWVYVGITTVITTNRVIYTLLWATTTTRPSTNRRQINETQYRNYQQRKLLWLRWAPGAQPATAQLSTAHGSTDQKGTYIGTQHNATVLQPRHLRLQPS